ncbi:MAG TPA: xanthine dehydrogenase family protein molybdopterin-binding subunit [Acidimicrobiia bacterium]|nr:xanthine dehydrogenase family protein molybdopterin-binding subunit [Acidimicrobiia bacterium]
MTSVIGSRLLRREDAPILTGSARYVDDLPVAGALHAKIVRSPYAHGRIRSIDTSTAAAMPGVVAVFTGEDLAGDFAAPLPCAWPVTPDMVNPPHWPLARGEACFAGDGVAVVVATSREVARDASESVVVDYEELPAVLDIEDAAADRVLAHADLSGNRSYTWELTPDPAAVDAAFAGATHVVRERYVQQRLIPMAMEPRGVCVVPEPYGGDFTVYSSTQIPHILKIMLAVVSGVAEHQLRVVAPSVGGGFGSKLNVYAEEALCLALARRLGRVVRWNEDRSENALATTHGRGMIQDIELAADADGRIAAVRVHLLADMGAYLQLVTPGVPLLGSFLYTGVYDVPVMSFTCIGVFTNRTPTDAYRGAGRPEATFAIERAIESLARQVGVDSAEIRRRNFIPFEKFPYASAGSLVFDSGDYGPALDEAMRLAGYSDLRAEQARRRDTGSTRPLGIGFSSYVEMCGLAPSRALGSLNFGSGGWEHATIRVLPTGKVEVVTGTSPHGQGHETSWAMIVADRLGVPVEDVSVLHSDTAISHLGLDTYGSRSLAVGGSAVYAACEKVIAKARAIAAHQMEVAEEDLEFVDGEFRVRGTPASTMALQAIAFNAFLAHDLPEGVEPNLTADASYDPTNFTFPFGVHIAVVEVDEETGRVELVRYVAVDDCGQQVNPLIVEGQVHGGIVQGAAQALWEEATYDEQGQLRTSTLTDYLVPSAAEVPSLELAHTVTPSPSNAMGVKGVGEAGTIAAAPAVINAIVDALAPLGVTDIEMPASPERVWQTIRAARTGTGASAPTASSTGGAGAA